MLQHQLQRLENQEESSEIIDRKPTVVITDRVSFEIQRTNSFKAIGVLNRHINHNLEHRPTETDFADSVRKEVKTIKDELFIFGKIVFWWFSPDNDNHVVMYTYLIVAVNMMIFLYMSGHSMTPPWKASFSNETLIDYNGFYLPFLKARPYIIITYAFIHESSVHIISNCILYCILGYTSERKYGKIRCIILSIVSIIGGSLLHGAFCNQSNVIVGMSANIHGLITPMIFDVVQAIQHPETSYFPRIKLIVNITIVVSGLIANIRTSSKTSVTAHFGGFVCGSIVTLLYCNNWSILGKYRQRLESYIMYALLLFLALWFAVFSVYDWAYKTI